MQGFYGKGSLSRSEPMFNTSNDDLPPILLEQQWQNRKRDQDGAVHGGTAETASVKDKRLEQLALNSISSLLQCVQSPKVGSWREYKNTTNMQDSLHPVVESNWNLSETEINNLPCTEFHSMVDNILKSGRPREANRIENFNEIVVVGGLEGPRLEVPVAAPREVLQLNLQETFFLAGALAKLNVIDQMGNIMSLQEMWTTFKDAEAQFVQR